MTTMTYSETLTVTHCWCGIALAIPENLYRVANDEGRDVYCPLGHTFVYGDSYKERLAKAEKKIAAEQQRVRATRDLLEQEERSHSATKGHLTRVRKRVHRGVCPHCHRHFENVERHMASKHPKAVANE
jgi:hypothetical protein